MPFKPSLWSSFLAIFSTSSAPSVSARELRERTEEIRRAMTDLARVGNGRDGAGLALRIHYAPDLQALWFMRSELMGLLARTQGEQAARDSLSRLSRMFSGLLPDGLRSRPSPLDSDSTHGDSSLLR